MYNKINNPDKVLLAYLGRKKLVQSFNDRKWYGPKLPNGHAIALFGSVGESNYLHNVKFGREAYESHHTYHYLTDLMWFRNNPDLIQPSFLILGLVIRIINVPEVEFVELGTSLHAAAEKFNNVNNLLGVGPNLRHIGIEPSTWLAEIAQVLHPDLDLKIFESWQDVPPSSLPRFSFSSGVANYAFADTDELGSWLRQSRFSIIRERFCIDQELSDFIMGKRFVYFNLTHLISLLSNYHISVLSLVESSQIFDQPKDGIFIDAILCFHDLSPDELEIFNSSLQMVNPPNEPIHFNTYPPMTLTPNILNLDIDITTLSRMPWQKKYLRKAVRGKFFDYNNLLEEHLVQIHKIYGVIRPLKFMERLRSGVIRPLKFIERLRSLAKSKIRYLKSLLKI